MFGFSGLFVYIFLPNYKPDKDGSSSSELLERTEDSDSKDVSLFSVSKGLLYLLYPFSSDFNDSSSSSSSPESELIYSTG